MQYDKDAESTEQTSSMISDMTNSIKDIMYEMMGAMEEIAESAQQTADLSGKIMKVVANVSNEVDGVANMSINQESIAKELNEIVRKFQLE